MAEKQPKRPRDLNQWAKRMVDLATGEHEDAPQTPAGPSPQSLGGKARATSLKPKQRTEIAKKAARTRWKPRHESSDA